MRSAAVLLTGAGAAVAGPVRVMAMLASVTPSRMTHKTRSRLDLPFITSPPLQGGDVLKLCRPYVLSGQRPEPDVRNLFREQAHAPLPFPAGHARMPPGPRIL
jgi:hypothetical protein